MQSNALYALGKTGFWVIVLTLLLSCQSLLISYSKKEGLYAYNPTTAVLLAEITKFLISAAILTSQRENLNFRITRETFPYSVPALIYFIQNNLVFWALYYVDPTTYQVLVNLKILTTGTTIFISFK